MITRQSFSLFCFLLITSSLSAQVTAPSQTSEVGRGSSVLEQLKQNTSFGGYVIGQVTANDQKDASKQCDMNLRLVRIYADSRIGDFALKLQMQVNGNTSSLASPRIVDAWAEWQRFSFFRVKFGQMKRCFTFENPMHPWEIGFGTYSQFADRLAGFNDPVGEHPSNGRDFGLQVQGDLLPAADGHSWLHYQAGVFNGQGINQADKNSRKDLIGGLWVSPLKGLQIGAFGWTGNYVRTDGETAERRRYSFGLNYSRDWTVRAEWGVDNAYGRADAWYTAVGTPSFYSTKVFARWDVYRNAKSWDSAHSIYALSLMHSLYHNLRIQLNYAFHVNKMPSNALGRHYNAIDAQLYWRF